MIRKPKEREKAIELRKEGRSVKEIARLLNVSSSTVSLWVRHIQLSPSQKQRLADKVFIALQKGLITVNLPANNLANEAALSTTPNPSPEYFDPLEVKPSLEKEKNTKTLDTDPIINCNFQYLGTKQLRRSECSKSFECQVGAQWYIYTSKDKCLEDQKKAQISLPRVSASNLNSSEHLVSCLVSYPCTGNSFTYYVNQETCNNFQQGALGICSSAPGQATLDYINQDYERYVRGQTNNTGSYPSPDPAKITSCKYQVVENYNQKVRICDGQASAGGYSSSSAHDACISLADKERDTMLSNCTGY